MRILNFVCYDLPKIAIIMLFYTVSMDPLQIIDVWWDRVSFVNKKFAKVVCNMEGK